MSVRNIYNCKISIYDNVVDIDTLAIPIKNIAFLEYNRDTKILCINIIGAQTIVAHNVDNEQYVQLWMKLG